MSSTAVRIQPRAGAKTAGDFEPGTFGWVASDLDDPKIEREWFKGRYEIVEGVLAKMPPAYFTGGSALTELINQVTWHLRQRGHKWRFATEVEVVVDQIRVPRADAVLLSKEDAQKQRAAAKVAGKRDPRRALILVPPTLVIESVSPGHELYDRRTKRQWYAEFGVPNYWILDAFERSLECLRLARGSKYVRDAAGKGAQKIKPSCFGDLVLNLADLWDEGGEDEGD